MTFLALKPVNTMLAAHLQEQVLFFRVEVNLPLHLLTWNLSVLSVRFCRADHF